MALGYMPLQFTCLICSCIVCEKTEDKIKQEKHVGNKQNNARSCVITWLYSQQMVTSQIHQLEDRISWYQEVGEP
jgi:hypothetical protein